MSLLCLAHHAVRLWRSPRRWPPGATNPVQILEISRFLPCFFGKMAVFDKTEPLVMMPCDKTEPLVMMPCEALSLLLSRLSCLTRHAFAAAVKTEVSNEKELCESHANGAQGETELPDRRSCPTRQSCPTRMGSVVRPAYNQSGGV